MVPRGSFISMARGNLQVEHLLRRAAFGPNAQDLLRFGDASTSIVSSYLIDYDRVADDVDSKVGQPGYVGTTSPGRAFSPYTNIEDARQRWLFRMVHSQRPLQEKMALFWHNHFATAYSKIAGVYGAVQATKMLALKAGELPGPQGQIELFRQYALGNFRNLLIEVAKDPAMLVWLDGRTNTRARPQENFGREIMELFTFGVGNYTEQDVYAAARVFTGWNLRAVATPGGANDPGHLLRVRLQREPARHDGEDVHLRHLRQRQDDSGARCRRRDAGRHRLDLRARAAPGNGAAPGAQAVEFLRHRLRGARPLVRRDDRGRVPPQQHRDEAGDQRNPAIGLVPRRAELEHALLVAGGIRRPGDSGGRLGRVFGRYGPDAADQHGSDAVRAA